MLAGPVDQWSVVECLAGHILVVTFYFRTLFSYIHQTLLVRRNLAISCL